MGEEVCVHRKVSLHKSEKYKTQDSGLGEIYTVLRKVCEGVVYANTLVREEHKSPDATVVIRRAA